MKDNQTGFTLIELMLVIAIIGILAGVAIPQYGQYAKRAKFTDVIAQAIPYKMAIGFCIQNNNKLDPCDSGYNGGDINIGSVTTPNGNLASLSVTNGSITATGTTEVGGAIYKLDPTYNSTLNKLTWSRDDSMAKACLTLKVCQ